MAGDEHGRSGAVGGREIIGLGGFLVGCVVAGLLLGWLADDRWGSSPLGVLVGVGVGVVVGVVGSCVQVARYLRS